MSQVAHPTPLTGQRIRLAFVSLMEGERWGGSESLWSSSAQLALDAGHEVIISSFAWPEPPKPVAALIQRGAQWLPWSVPSQEGAGRRWLRRIGGHRSPFSDPLRRLLSSFKPVFDLKPDVFCINQGWTLDCLNHHEFLQLLTLSGIPYATLCRATDDGGLPSRERRDEAREFFRKARYIGFASQAGIESTERHLACRLANTNVLHSPIRVAKAPALEWPRGHASFASVGRLHSGHKGQDLLLAALARDVWKDRDWSLTLYGEGPDTDALCDLVAQYGLRDRVAFAGFESLATSIWSRHQMLVLPSRIEGTPQALIEAMLLGRPAVATDVGGITEWASEPDNAFIAPAASVRSLAAALERAWQARPDWCEMGLRARAAALQRLDPDPAARLFHTLLSLTPARANAPRPAPAPDSPTASNNLAAHTEAASLGSGRNNPSTAAGKNSIPA